MISGHRCRQIGNVWLQVSTLIFRDLIKWLLGEKCICCLFGKWENNIILVGNSRRAEKLQANKPVLSPRCSLIFFFNHPWCLHSLVLRPQPLDRELSRRFSISDIFKITGRALFTDILLRCKRMPTKGRRRAGRNNFEWSWPPLLRVVNYQCNWGWNAAYL